MKKTIGIIGCGNMGAAIAKALLGVGCRVKGKGSRVKGQGLRVYGYDADKKRSSYVAKQYKVKIASSAADLVDKCDVIILAVKPQNISEVLEEVAYNIDTSKLLISIAAGIKTAAIEKGVGKKVAVIRAMPNMPALIRAGVSAISKGRFATKRDLETARRLFLAVGEVVEIKENLMDAVTAISGSGPAYFFYLVEVLIKSAENLGLEEKVAKRLAIETALGSAHLLKETAQMPDLLRAKVTSKGGVTEAAFVEFFKNDLGVILERGIRKAYERAKCL
jgi:pyrroline-5-carboxylate reductase